MASAPDFARVPCPAVAPQPLAPLAESAARQLTARGETVTVFDATAGGLIFASLLAVPGASKYATCAGNHISTRRSVQVLGSDLVQQLVLERPQDGAAYQASKREAVLAVARHTREAVGATWSIAESGACGPTFSFPGIEQGFTAICVSGPVEKAVFVESSHADREANMWGFTKVALDLLAECLAEASSAPPAEPPSKRMALAQVLKGTEDRFSGVTVDIPGGCEATVLEFTTELRSSLARWRAGGKRGIWFTVPPRFARFVPVLTSHGFEFHHAKPQHVALTLWLGDSPSPLPRYGFTQVGVGGLVTNSKGSVLMVQERISPDARFQGTWKFPGGLQDPGEDLGATAAREVREETGVLSEPVGLVSMRHAHGIRFGMSDLYCVVKLRAVSEEIKIDPEEIGDARWMSLEEIAAMVPADPASIKGGGNTVSPTTFQIIEQALGGPLISGTLTPSARGGAAMIYLASGPSAAPGKA